MQKTVLRLNKLLIVFLGLSLSCISKNSFLSPRDTTIILAYEVCTDSTILNCWTVNQGDFAMRGLIPVDLLKHDVKYQDGYFIYLSHHLNSNVIDSIEYLNLKGNKQNGTALQWGLNVQIPFDSILLSKCTRGNLLFIEDKQLNKALSKKKKRSQFLKKYSYNLLSNNYAVSGNRMYYLFKINMEYIPSRVAIADRLIVTSKGKVREVKIPYYFIIRVKTVEPYMLGNVPD